MAGMWMKPDGSKLFLLGRGNKTVYQYSLSTAYDVSTASYDEVSFSVNSQEATPHAIAFDSNGDHLYVVGTTESKIFQYNLSTAWDVSTASYASKMFSLGASVLARGLWVNNSHVVTIQNSDDTIRRYTWGTVWDISTLSAAGDLTGVNAVENAPTGVMVEDAGDYLVFCGQERSYVQRWSMSSAFDISSAAADDTNATVGSPDDIHGTYGNSKTYVLVSNTVYEFDGPLATPEPEVTIPNEATTTDGDASVTVTTIPRALASRAVGLSIFELSGNAGFFSVDGGTNWRYLPANGSVNIESIARARSIQIKRVAGGSDISVLTNYWPPER